MDIYKIRNARVGDEKAIFEIITANQDNLILRSLADISAHIDHFCVAQLTEGAEQQIIGCAAFCLHPELGKITGTIGEIQSLAVASKWRRRGIATALTNFLLVRLTDLGVEAVLSLTFTPEFFASLGFIPADKREFMHKLYSGCINCTRFADPFTCPEQAMFKKLN